MLVHLDFLVGLDSILEWAISGVGLDINEPIEIEDFEDSMGCIPFIHWPEGKFKAHCREEVGLGWKEAIRGVDEG